jgi:hypothetical protein
MGLGEQIEAVLQMFRLPLGAPGQPITEVLLSKRDLFVSAEQGSARLRDCEPIKTLKPACFGLFPLVVDDRVLGCLYFDRILPLPLSDPGILEAIGRIRDSAAVAIRATARYR